MTKPYEYQCIFCDLCHTPEQAADLSHNIINSLVKYYNKIKKENAKP